MITTIKTAIYSTVIFVQNFKNALVSARQDALAELAHGGCLSPSTHPSLSAEQSAAAQKNRDSYAASLKRLNKKHGF